MLDEAKKKSVQSRLNRIQGQIGGISRMVEEDRYCMDIMNQTAAIISALRNVENIILENHLNTCVVEAMRSSDPREHAEKTDEIMSIFSRFRS